MSKKRDVHVVPHQAGWAMRREGAQRAGAIFDTQAEAIDAGLHSTITICAFFSSRSISLLKFAPPWTWRSHQTV